MKVKLIQTNAEYEAALDRIEKLMDAAPNTPQGDELDLLSRLVHDYEEKTFPDRQARPCGGDSISDGATRTRTKRLGGTWKRFSL